MISANEDQAVAVLQRHRGTGDDCAGIHRWGLRALDEPQGAQAREADGLYTIALRIPQRDAVLELALPDAFLPSGGLPGARCARERLPEVAEARIHVRVAQRDSGRGVDGKLVEPVLGIPLAVDLEVAVAHQAGRQGV